MKSHNNVLFLCTGNSARSLDTGGSDLPTMKAEVGFQAFSGAAIQEATSIQLHSHCSASLDFQRKAIDQRVGTSLPKTVRRQSTSSSRCATMPLARSVPIWPGKPVKKHWGIPDPAAVKEARQPEAFREAYDALHERIGKLLAREAVGG